MLWQLSPEKQRDFVTITASLFLELSGKKDVGLIDEAYNFASMVREIAEWCMLKRWWDPKSLRVFIKHKDHAIVEE